MFEDMGSRGSRRPAGASVEKATSSEVLHDPRRSQEEDDRGTEAEAPSHCLIEPRRLTGGPRSNIAARRHHLGSACLRYVPPAEEETS